MSLWHRLWNLVAYGTSSVVDDSGPVQKMQAQIGPYETRDGAPYVQLFGLSANPPAGTDLVLIFPAGDRAAGVAVASNHQASRPKGQQAGETTLFNNFAMSIALTANGIVVNGGNKPLIIENAPTITSDAALFRVAGDIQDNYETNPRTVANMRSIYDTHDHGGVTSGAANTNAPNQQM